MAPKRTETKVNGIDLEVLQGTIQAIEQDPELAKCQFRTRNKWISGDHNCSQITSFYGAKQEIVHRRPFEIHADEPAVLAGEDQAPNPAEHLLNALAGCVTTGMVAHAAVRGIHIRELESEVEGDLDLRGFLGLSDESPKGYTNIRVRFKVKADTDNMERLKRLTEYSPVFNTLMQGVKVDVEVEPK
jgi:uncharacterized OsmC-like protein